MLSLPPIEIEKAASHSVALIDLENIKISWKRKFDCDFEYSDLVLLCNTAEKLTRTKMLRVVIFATDPEAHRALEIRRRVRHLLQDLEVRRIPILSKAKQGPSPNIIWSSYRVEKVLEYKSLLCGLHWCVSQQDIMCNNVLSHILEDSRCAALVDVLCSIRKVGARGATFSDLIPDIIPAPEVADSLQQLLSSGGNSHWSVPEEVCRGNTLISHLRMDHEATESKKSWETQVAVRAAKMLVNKKVASTKRRRLNVDNINLPENSGETSNWNSDGLVCVIDDDEDDANTEAQHETASTETVEDETRGSTDGVPLPGQEKVRSVAPTDDSEGSGVCSFGNFEPLTASEDEGDASDGSKIGSSSDTDMADIINQMNSLSDVSGGEDEIDESDRLAVGNDDSGAPQYTFVYDAYLHSKTNVDSPENFFPSHDSLGRRQSAGETALFSYCPAGSPVLKPAAETSVPLLEISNAQKGDDSVPVCAQAKAASSTGRPSIIEIDHIPESRVPSTRPHGTVNSTRLLTGSVSPTVRAGKEVRVKMKNEVSSNVEILDVDDAKTEQPKVWQRFPEVPELRPPRNSLCNLKFRSVAVDGKAMFRLDKRTYPPEFREVSLKLFGYKQKGRGVVQRGCDVCLGSELTKLCFHPNVDTIILFSGDSDFNDVVGDCMALEDYGGALKFSKTCYVAAFRDSFRRSMFNDKDPNLSGSNLKTMVIDDFDAIRRRSRKALGNSQPPRLQRHRPRMNQYRNPNANQPVYGS